MRKFGILLVSVAGLMALGGAATASTPEAQNSTQILWGAGAVADSSGTPGATADAKPADPDADKVVCKTLPPPTGSRIGTRRQCMTQAQWDDAQRQSQQATEHQQLNGLQQGIPGH